MNNALKNKRRRRIIKSEIHTILATVLSCLVFLISINNVYHNAESEGFNYLHMQTRQVKENLRLHILSDRETLSSIAGVAGKLYERGEDISMVLNSFEPFGLVENIGILMPDNTLVTKYGTVTPDISFEEEAAKRDYTSGRVPDLTNPDRETLRSAVPVMSDGEVVAMLYGIIELGKLNSIYSDMIADIDAQLYVYDKKSGDFLIDTVNDTLGNIEALKSRQYKKGFSYEQIINEENGYSSFWSIIQEKYLYVHYADIGIGDWRIMLARPEDKVFENASSIVVTMLHSFLFMVGLIVVYLGLVFRYRNRKNEVTVAASYIRKLLLEINNQHVNITEALKYIAIFGKARSSFFIDTDGEDYNYIFPEFNNELLNGKDRKHFVAETMKIAAEKKGGDNAAVRIVSVKADAHLERSNADLYKFLKKHKIKEYHFSVISDRSNHISILGSINPGRSGSVKSLIEDISICFSMAIYNKKHLALTELAATTDSLTGLLNSASYVKDINRFNELQPDSFGCVYIDVNGLHLLNNRYGHAAGDEMLRYIANTLKEVFYGNRIYRIGGDEFMVFTEGVDADTLNANADILKEKIKPMDYHVATGIAYVHGGDVIDVESVVKKAEKRMYKEKARYYQNKEIASVSHVVDNSYEYSKTGVDEIDALMHIIKEHYGAVYSVKLNTGEMSLIFGPSYFGNVKNGDEFSKVFTKYVFENVNPDFHRAMMSFLNYDVIKKQIADGEIPQITYKKITGDTLALCVYATGDDLGRIDSTLWVFKKV